MSDEVEARIEAERVRRLIEGPYHHWKARGDDGPPAREYWCDYCAGYYGVPHDGTHDHGLCPFTRHPYPGQCACIDCHVVEGRTVASE